jgi:HlyD family secretion protein
MTSAVGRRLWIIVVGAVALIILLVYLGSRGSIARVAVADVVRQNLSAVVSTNGKVEPVTPRSFRAGYPTFVERVYVVEGQQVKRGQMLFGLDDTEVQADLAQARADLATQQEALNVAKAGGYASQVARALGDLQKAQASRDQLRRENDSLTKLVAEKAATQAELDQNQLQLVQAESDVKSFAKVKQTLEQQAQLDQGRVALLVEHARVTVRDLEERVESAHGTAPFDGTLYSLPIRQGDFVKAGDLLAELADLRRLRIRAFVDEPDLGQLDVNQPVEIRWDAHPDRVWNGLTEVLPKQVVTRGTRNVGELICSVTNDRLDLLPNTTVDVRIQIRQRPAALVVPRGAVFIEGDKRFVYRVEESRLHKVPIKVGISDPTSIEAVSGLNEGDVVALPGDAPLKDNLRIKAVRPE